MTALNRAAMRSRELSTRLTYVEPAQLDATTATIDDGDDTQQHEGESHEAYEDRLNGMIPPSEYFCCRPVFF